MGSMSHAMDNQLQNDSKQVDDTDRLGFGDQLTDQHFRKASLKQLEKWEIDCNDQVSGRTLTQQAGFSESQEDGVRGKS